MLCHTTLWTLDLYTEVDILRVLLQEWSVYGITENCTSVLATDDTEEPSINPQQLY